MLRYFFIAIDDDAVFSSRATNLENLYIFSDDASKIENRLLKKSEIIQAVISTLFGLIPLLSCFNWILFYCCSGNQRGGVVVRASALQSIDQFQFPCQIVLKALKT